MMQQFLIDFDAGMYNYQALAVLAGLVILYQCIKAWKEIDKQWMKY